MANNVTINYLNRDFQGIKQDLINFAKKYHSDKLLFFNDSNPDIMYLEMVAYVGDLLNYYMDKTFNESFRSTAQARESLVRIADNLGYFNWGPSSSFTQIILSIDVPFIIDSSSVLKPDSDYLLSIEGGLVAVSDSGIQFEVLDEVNFADSRNRVIVPNLDSNGQLINYTIKKYVTAYAGETKIQRFYIDSDKAKPFLQITLDDLDILEITGVVNVPGNIFVAPTNSTFDFSENKFYEVKHLAIDKLFVPINPELILDPVEKNKQIENSVKQGQYIEIPKRFISRRDVNGLLTLTFGNQQTGFSTFKDLINQGPVSGDTNLSTILNNTTLGEIPDPDSTIFIRYRVKGGTDTNVATGQINSIISSKILPPQGNPNLNQLQQVRRSLKISNEIPAVGGRDQLSNEEIRQYSGAIYSTQDRAVTPEDFPAIIQDMPVSFGSPFRISIEEIKPKISTMSDVRRGLEILINGEDGLLKQSTQVNRELKYQEIEQFLDDTENGIAYIPPNTDPIAYSEYTVALLNSLPSLWIGEKIRIYIIGIDENNKLTTLIKDSNGIFQSPNQVLKENIRKYLISKRLIGDWIDIVDGRVVNIQIEFSIIADPSRKRQVLTDCLNSIKSYFDITKWQMNQPIFIDNARTILQEINGVINVVDMKFYNIFGIDPESGREYQIEELGRYRRNLSTPLNLSNNKFEMEKVNNTILGYPDSIFELKYPDSDIVGKVL